MENKRDKICIIMAGYKKEMEQVLEMNRGLSSRINFYIDFEDLSAEQLYNIFTKLCKEENYKLQPTIKKLLITYFESAIKQEHFSNGRLVRNIFDHTKIEQANRISSDQNANVNLITKTDITNVLKEFQRQQTTEKIKIGFNV